MIQRNPKCPARLFPSRAEPVQDRRTAKASAPPPNVGTADTTAALRHYPTGLRMKPSVKLVSPTPRGNWRTVVQRSARVEQRQGGLVAGSTGWGGRRHQSQPLRACD